MLRGVFGSGDVENTRNDLFVAPVKIGISKPIYRNLFGLTEAVSCGLLL